MTMERLLAYHNPELISEWHPNLNGDITPYNITYGSGYPAWWQLFYYDSKTQKTFNFEWQAAVYHRTKGEGCPYLVGKKIYIGFNDLYSVCPDIAKEFHPLKNKDLSAKQVFAHSNKPVWWLYPYDDPETGKHFDFEWEASPAARNNSPGCPFVSNQRIWPGYNDLKTKYPRIASEWNYSKNKKNPEDYMPNSRDEVWWYLPYDVPMDYPVEKLRGKHFDFEWKARITNRVQDDGHCPILSNNAVWPGYNDLESLRPDLAIEWDCTKNGKLLPSAVTLYSNIKRWWICPRCGKGWRASPAKRADGQECKCNRYS